MHARQREVPDQIGLGERRDEPARRGVHMHRNIRPSARCQLIKGGADLAHRLVAAVERRAENRHDADRVLVAVGERRLGGEVEAIALHRDQSWLDVPIATELVPTHLDVDAEDEVGPVGRLARSPHPLSPQPLESQATQHRGLAGAGRRAARHVTLPRRVPEPADHVHAPALELRCLRVLVLVDHVLVRRLGHQAGGVRRHPRRHERGQVQTGAAVQQQLVRHQVIGHLGPRALLGNLIARQPDKLLLLNHRGGTRDVAIADLGFAALSRGAHAGLPFVRLGTQTWRGPVLRR